MEIRGRGVLAIANQRRRRTRQFPLPSFPSKSDGAKWVRWWLLAFVSRVLSYFAIHANFANAYGHFALWCLAVWRDVAICRVAGVFSHVTKHEPHVADLQPYLTTVLSNIAHIQPYFAYIFSHFTTLFQHLAEL